jgi:hypothetical protein
MNRVTSVLCAVGLILVPAGVSAANWADSFDGGEFDLATWQFPAFPDVTGTFTQTLAAGADENDYLALAETTSAGAGGAAFGAGFGSEEVFQDVRVSAVVNVAGDASHNYHGLIARASYFIDPDGSLTGVAPGVVADCYVMHIDWEDGPANLNIDIEKVIQNQNIMDEDVEAVIPGLANERSFYAELDVVGSGPVHVTGSLYESKGGPLVARVSMIDTNANDPWEDAGVRDEVFTEGISGIFAQNEQEEPAGFYVTFDDVASVSDGPSAVAPSPAPGARGVSLMPTLSWIEAAFATGRQVWVGKAGEEMVMVEPAPDGMNYAPGLLEANTTYQWRVDQVGVDGVAAGHTWAFTTGEAILVDDFESYANTDEIAAAWPHNIPPSTSGQPFPYVFLETGKVRQGTKAMRFEYQNQYDPFLTEATLTFETPQDWTLLASPCLTMDCRGEDDNVEQPLFVRLEDAAGNQATVAHPFDYAVQSEPWRVWGPIPLTEFEGVDVSAMAKLTIGLGDGAAPSGQQDEDRDMIYIDAIRVCSGAEPEAAE